ncbi:hypothetical protein KR009_009727 [Drosophila setifemur]|nr:hypothetical protein KR009_009727 [Drosophila setifemur]
MSQVLVFKFWGSIASSASLGRCRSQLKSRWSSSVACPKVAVSEENEDSQEQRTLEEPHVIFQRWLMSAQEQAPQVRPRLACMATVDMAGPVTRLTNIEDVSAKGITFFTTLGSRQAGEISQNPHVSLHFNWAPLMRSVRIAGTAYQLNTAQALDQFRRYPRQVQLSITHGPRYAAADFQARSGFFQKIVQQLTTWFGRPPEEIAMPANWGGYLLAPSLFEFGTLYGTGKKRLRFRKCIEMPRVSPCSHL